MPETQNPTPLQRSEFHLRYLMNAIRTLQSECPIPENGKAFLKTQVVSFLAKTQSSDLPEEYKLAVAKLEIMSFSEADIEDFIEQCRQLVFLNYRLRKT